MERRRWDGWVQVVREPHPPVERWPSVGRNESAVHPMPSHSGRGQIAHTGRWRQRKMHVAPGRRGGSEEEGRRDGGRLGNIGGCWNDRRPRSVNVDSLFSEGKAVQHKNDQSMCS